MTAYPELARLYGWSSLMRGVRTDLDLAALVSKHLFPIEAMDSMADVIGLPGAARDRLVPRTTYARLKRTTGMLPEDKVGHVLHVARAFAKTLQHFDGDLDEARAFWVSEHPELDRKTPEETALSEPGARAVEALIERAALGLPV